VSFTATSFCFVLVVELPDSPFQKIHFFIPPLILLSDCPPQIPGFRFAPPDRRFNIFLPTIRIACACPSAGETSFPSHVNRTKHLNHLHIVRSPKRPKKSELFMQ
jgi:hypothetical protein